MLSQGGHRPGIPGNFKILEISGKSEQTEGKFSY